MFYQNKILVGAAVIRKDGKILICDRPKGDWAGYWEFPGGKIHDGESLHQALKREIREELAVEIDVFDQVYVIDYQYPDKKVRIHFCRCMLKNNSDQPVPEEGQNIAWSSIEKLSEFKFLPADAEFIDFLLI